eukprot:4186485-Alexandrium_andersonii.AAC.1
MECWRARSRALAVLFLKAQGSSQSHTARRCQVKRGTGVSTLKRVRRLLDVQEGRSNPPRLRASCAQVPP